jgi:hypothetical protein
MRLQLILPSVEPTVFEELSVCPYEGCHGKHFEHHQEVVKPLKDTKLDTVIAHRYRCLRCHGTFRVYPQLDFIHSIVSFCITDGLCEAF